MTENENPVPPADPAPENQPPAEPAREAATPAPEPAELAPLSLAELPPELQAACARAGWEKLMPVQERTAPYLLAGRDAMVQSRTGSGKTGAFMLPLLARLDPTRPECQALILAPTRELAQQVANEAERLFGTDEGAPRCAAVYGGVAYGPQLEAFRRGAHLVVGTPGRVLDHLMKRTFNLDSLEVLIFDEADRLLSMGFYPDMKQVQRFLPDRDVNACMFSATFPPYVLRLAREFMHEPTTISLSNDRVHVAETEHLFYQAPVMKRERCLVRIIEVENPASAIIFCNTKSSVHYVAVVLQRFGYDADEISSDLNQAQRDKVLTRVRKGNLRFLVATDVAARGIDIPELSHVIQYEPPEDPEAYIHRAGRTGRAGAAGVAITLVDGLEKINLTRIAKRFSIDLQEKSLPSDEDVETLVTQRVTALLEARLRNKDSLERERMQRFLPLAANLGRTDDELNVIAMLLDEYYQKTLHSPPEQPHDSEPEPKSSASTSGEPRRRRGRGRRRK